MMAHDQHNLHNQTEKVLVGIPAYNEEMTIAEVIEATHQALPACDIVVVNDGSEDGTASVVRSKNTLARLINLPCNLGYSNAIETLLRYATRGNYDVLVLIDADGQHDPKVLSAFLENFKQCDCNVLIGSRYIATRRYHHTPLGPSLGMIRF